MAATNFITVGRPYRDRHKHEPFCFNLNQDGFVTIKRFETEEARDLARLAWCAQPGVEVAQ